MARARTPAPVDPWVPRPELSTRLDSAWRADARCLTLVGPAGAGKTRAAVQWADGLSVPLVWVELATARTAAEVEDGVCQALGLALGSDRLRDVIRHQGELLLILDNAEQFEDAAGALIQQWLEAAPALRVLVTSRRALRLPAEIRVEVGPLAPHEARTLLLTRARARRPEFGTRPSEDAAVDALVERLDGLPLAIELTAARSREMTATELLARLDQRLQLLVRWRWQGPQRHRSLRAALDSSWELLDPATQRTLAELSTFRGDFDPEAAGGVCTSPDVARHLGRLRADSLVLREATGRHRLLVSVRDYAERHLEATAEQAEDTQRRHLRVFCERARQLGFTTTAKARAVRILGPDRENLRVAAERGLALGLLVEASICAEAIGILGVWNGHIPGAMELIDRVLARPELPRDRALVLRAQRGSFHKRLGNGGRAEEELRAVITDAADHPRVRTQARMSLAAVLWNHRRTEEAVELVESGLRESRAVHDAIGECHASALLARHHAGDIEAHARRAVDLALQIEAGPWQAYALGALAEFHAQEQGLVDLAEHELRQAIALCVDAGHVLAEAAHLNNLGLLLFETGRVPAAVAPLERAIAMHRAGGNAKGQGIAVANLGRTRSLLGQHRRAEALGREALVLVGDKEHRLRGPLQRYLGLSLWQARRPAAAIAMHRAALDVAAAAGDDKLAALLRAELADWETPEDDAALVMIEQSIATLAGERGAWALGTPRSRATILRIQARALRRAGRLSRALGVIESAQAMLASFRDLVTASRLELERVRLLTLLGQPERARRALAAVQSATREAGLGVDTPLGEETAEVARAIATSVRPFSRSPGGDSGRKRGAEHEESGPDHHREDDRSPT